MRVTLIHNHGAGNTPHFGDELMQLLREAGHEVEYWSTENSEYLNAFEDSADAIIAAGGDGTVRKVALALIGRNIPLGILPVGTINNIARSLGIMDSPAKLISGLATARRQGLDLGMVKGSWGSQRFIESFGMGMLAEYMRVANEMPSSAASSRVLRDLSLLYNICTDYPVREYKIVVDGEDVSGDYLFVEMMNIRSIGPAILLAPEALSHDGSLDWVAVSEADREKFAEYISRRIKGQEIALSLDRKRFRHMTLEADNLISHSDDQLLTTPDFDRCAIEITVQSHALEVLIPDDAEKP